MTSIPRLEAGESGDQVVVAIDAGKTKFSIGVFTTLLSKIEHHHLPVTTPSDTLAAMLAVLGPIFTRFSVQRIGLSVFGPLETDASSPDFGAIVTSSEPAWSAVNLPSILADRFDAPVIFDFDVNAAALAEGHLMETPAEFMYLSIGTGIGGTFYRPQQSTLSRLADPPQIGHIYLPPEPDDFYPGGCRFHGGCFQGLASGRALHERWQMPPTRLPPDHRAWDLEARYVARACSNILYSSTFTAIRIGSGISQAPGLIDRSNLYLHSFMSGFPGPLWGRIIGRVIERAATAPHSSLVGAAVQAIEGVGLFRAPG